MRSCSKVILLGKRSDLPTETLDIFRNSGTFHVLAVSGLHVGLVAMFCYFGFLVLSAATEDAVSANHRGSADVCLLDRVPSFRLPRRADGDPLSFGNTDGPGCGSSSIC